MSVRRGTLSRSKVKRKSGIVLALWNFKRKFWDKGRCTPKSAPTQPTGEHWQGYHLKESSYLHSKAKSVYTCQGMVSARKGRRILSASREKSERNAVRGHQEPPSAGHSSRLIRSFYAASVPVFSQITFWLWHLTPCYVYPETQDTCPHWQVRLSSFNFQICEFSSSEAKDITLLLVQMTLREEIRK